jgi:HlyD family secretion protein
VFPVRRPRRFAIALAASLLIVEARLGVQNNTSNVQITIAPVTEGAIVPRVVATGTLRAVTTVDVGADVAGVVQSLEADVNAVVHAGQVVAHLEPASFDAQLHEARASLLHAEIAVRAFELDAQDARDKLTRAEELSARQIISLSDLNAARLVHDEATARLFAGEAAEVEAQAAVDRADIDLSHTIIRSPVDGIIIERNVVAGQTLSAPIGSAALFRIAAALDQMQVQLEIDQPDVDVVAPQETATFEVDSYGSETFHGTVSEIRPHTMAQQATTAIVDVPNPGERLRPGMKAEVTLNGPRHEAVVRIPNAALSFRPPLEVLAALGESGAVAASQAPSSTRRENGRACEVWEYDGEQLIPIAVRAGLSGDGWTELLSGPIHPGDPLVTRAVLQSPH